MATKEYTRVKRLAEARIRTKLLIFRGAPEIWEVAREIATLILSIKGIAIEADDQSLPDNLVWHKKDREFEAYCAGHNDMLEANFKRVVNGD